MLSGSLDRRGKQNREHSHQPRWPRPGAQGQPAAPGGGASLSHLHGFLQPLVSSTPSLTLSPCGLRPPYPTNLSRAGVVPGWRECQAGVATHRLCPLDPTPLEGWSEEEAQTLDPASPGESPRQQLPVQPPSPSQPPSPAGSDEVLTESSRGAGTWPPRRWRWTATSSHSRPRAARSAGGKDKSAGWEGILCAPQPASSGPGGRRGRQGPLEDTLANQAHALHPAPPFILPFLGVGAEAWGWAAWLQTRLGAWAAGASQSRHP